MKTLFFRCCFICLSAFLGFIVAPQAAAQVKPLDEKGQVETEERSGALIQVASPDNLKVVLLGTGVGPPVNLRQYGASTLIEAGGVRLLFDCGRGATIRLAQVGVPLDSVSRLFLTHLHSDHVIQIPDLLLTGWVGGGRGGLTTACTRRPVSGPLMHSFVWLTSLMGIPFDEPKASLGGAA